MADLEYPAPLRDAISSLKKLPGIGGRSAERIALWLLKQAAVTDALAGSLAKLNREVALCDECGFFREESRCAQCGDPRRDPWIWVIVEQPTDMPALDRAEGFRGRFLSLGGRLSPLDGIGPGNLRLAPLLRAARSGLLGEVVLALSTDVEGEATSHYVAGLLREISAEIKVTQLARGLPVGGSLDSTDGLTLAKALLHRLPLSD